MWDILGYSGIQGALCFFGRLRLRQKEGVTWITESKRRRKGHPWQRDTGQGITSSSTYAHVQGAYGAPTGAVGGAAAGTRRGAETP